MLSILKFGNNSINASVEHWGSDQLADGNKITYQADTLQANIGNAVFIQDSPQNFSLAPDGRFCLKNGTYFTINEGVLTSAPLVSQIKTNPQLINQGFSSMHIEPLEIKKDQPIKMAKLDIEDISGAGKNAGTPKAVNKDSTPGKSGISLSWNKLARFRELQSRDNPNMTFDPKLNQGNGTWLTNEKLAKAKADRHYVDTGEKLDAKQFMPEAHSAQPSTVKDARLDPRLANHIWISDTASGQDAEATEALKEIPQKVEQKKISEQDKAFEKAKSFFSAKPKKEINPELKARLIQLGYIRPDA